MWVRSQNKKELANKTNLLGLYYTMEIALDELTKLQSALVNNIKVYEMS